MLKLSVFVVLLVCCFIEVVESVEAREVLRARLAMKRNALKVIETKVVDTKADIEELSSVHQQQANPISREHSFVETDASVKQREGSDNPSISIIDLIGPVAEVEVQSSKSGNKEMDSELLEQAAAEGKVEGCTPLIPRTCPNGLPLAEVKQSSPQPPTPAVGCGPSLPTNPVMDSLKNSILNDKFSDCCNAHYSCYSLFRATKDDCDHSFYHCMLRKCLGWWCKTKAYGYYLAVSEDGCQTFEQCQVDSVCKT